MPTSEVQDPESSSKPSDESRTDGNPEIADTTVADGGPDSRVPDPSPGPYRGTTDGSMDHAGVAAAPAVRTYSSEEAIDRRDETGVRFVDVREAHEVTEGIVPGAVHIPLDRVEVAIDPDSPDYDAAFGDVAELVFYCRSGRRSAIAVRRATEMGIDRVAHVAGGIRAWADADGPVQTGSAPDRL